MTPLISRMLRHAFLSGIVAARNTPGHDEIDGPSLCADYKPAPEDLAKLEAVCDHPCWECRLLEKDNNKTGRD